jgi:FkbM family methyltransferase
MSMRERDDLEVSAYRRARWVPGLDEHSALCRVLDSFWMYVDTRDTSLTPHLLTDGYWEPWVTLAIAKHVKPGMRCVDIGANVGYFALLMAKIVGDKGSVSAYEPQDRMAALLNKSAKINGVQRFTGAACHALGSKTELRRLVLYGSEMGSVKLDNAEYSGGGTLGERVQIFALDDVLETEPQFIKIDAEGSEPEIWDGMQRILREQRPTVALEFGRTFYPDPGAVLKKFTDSGYALGVIEYDGSIGPSSERELLGGDHDDKEMLWLAPM